MSKRKHPSKEILEELYLNQKLTATNIAEKYNISKACLCKALHNFKIPIRPCIGKNHPSWKGGRVIKSGYIAIWNPKHHRTSNVGYVFEHILIMERELCRQITKDEHIHHIDFDRQNNEITNLYVTSPHNHRLAEKSISELIKPLLNQNIIEFKDGKYIQC